MKKRLLSIVLAVFVLALGFSACSKTTTQPADADGDAIEQAVYDYLTTEVSKSYDKADACIPTMTIADYVKANGLEVTQYHDYGWDPVALK